MTTPLRIIDTGLLGARRNIAVTAALGAMHASGLIGDLVRFHRYPASVLLGQSQDAATSADLIYCAEEGFEIARRLTGGGAVFMSPTMLAWDILFDRRSVGGDVVSATELMCGAIADGLRQLGVPATFRVPGEIEIDGLKVSGSAGWTAGRSVLLQGSLIITDELGLMKRSLMIPEAQIRAKVTCLGAAGFANLDRAAIIDSLARSLCKHLSRALHWAELTAEELAECDIVHTEVGSDEYVLGSPSDLNRQ